MKRLQGIAVVVAAGLLLSCQGIHSSSTSLVTVTVHGTASASLEVRPMTALSRVERFLANVFRTRTAAAAIPSSVSDIRVTVSASDMDTIAATVPVAGLPDVAITIEVPNGTGRDFLVEGLDASGTTIYRGHATADLEGLPVSLAVTLVSLITPADTIPPTFTGLDIITDFSYNSMQLTWTPATDDVTPSSGIVYLIYQSTTPGGENFGAPTYTTAPGVNTYLVNGLNFATVYYFVVRAQDAAGNIDTNTVELSSYYPGMYVSINTGADLAGCGPANNPCQTITYVLSQLTGTIIAFGPSSGTSNIFVAQGLYSSASGSTKSETLPFVLPASTSLICYGPDFSTIIDDGGMPNATGAMVMGTAGAVITGCRFTVANFPTTITDNGGIMTMINNDLEASGFNPHTGIQIAADSIVSNSTISGFFFDGVGHGVEIDGGNAGVSQNYFTGNGNAVYIAGGSPLVSQNTLTANYWGMNIVGGSPTISGNTIYLSSTYGLYLTGGDPVISGNTIAFGSYGIYSSTSSTTMKISGNTIDNNINSGISLNAGAPIIDSNTIYSNNTFTYSSAGILISNASPTVTNNTITNNGIGVYVLTTSGPAPVVNFNTLSCNIGEDLYSSFTPSFDATNNSWDHSPPSTPVAACTQGMDICGVLPTYVPYGPTVASPCP